MWAIWRRFRRNKNVEFVIKTNGTRKLNLRAWPSIGEAGGLLKTTSKVGMDLVADIVIRWCPNKDIHSNQTDLTRIKLKFFKNARICTFWIFIVDVGNYEQNWKHHHQASARQNSKSGGLLRGEHQWWWPNSEQFFMHIHLVIESIHYSYTK